jgi:hypothetical protein
MGEQSLDRSRFGSATTLHGSPELPLVIPSVPGFPTSPLSPATTYVVLPKENHAKLPKPQLSTGNPGEPRDLRFYGPFVEMFFGSHARSEGRP